MCRKKTVSCRVVFVASLLLIGSLLGAAFSAPVAAQAPATGVTVFEGARVIVGNRSAPIENAAFIVNNGRFVQVGRNGELQVPPGATRVDLTGKTVMPAIIDAHTHLPSETRESLIDSLERKAYWGNGAVLSLGRDTGDMPFQVRQETLSNAARFLSAGMGITWIENDASGRVHLISSEAEARQAVQVAAPKNPNLIKIWVDDQKRRGPNDDVKLTPAMYGAIIDEAHKHGVRVIAHHYYLEDTKGLLRAGADAFAHGLWGGEYIDEECLALFKERPNFVVVPNMRPRGEAIDLSWLSDVVPAEQFQTMQQRNRDQPAAREASAIESSNLRQLVAAGVRIAFGTDGSTPWNAQLEMADMVAAGMTPAQVIEAATSTTADFLRLTDVGTVQAGKSADFIVLNANPLDDITNMRHIADVYLRGTAVDRAGLRARWNSGAAAGN